MQSRFNKFDNLINIPLTGGRFSISLSGNVYSNVDRMFIKKEYNDKNEPLVEIETGDRSFKLKISVLLAIVTKRIFIPHSLFDKLDVHYVDGNQENFHPGNTVWKFPKGGLKFKEDSDFCFIPGFSRYLINPHGEVFSTMVGRLLSPYSDQEGYWMFGLTPDVGKRTIVGRHRALALAFLEYPENVDSLDVNHLNGDKSDNSLDNLEWASRSRNCEHAYSTGLRTDNTVIDVRNSFTGEIQSFYSIQECSRKLGIKGSTITLRLKTPGQPVYPPGYQFKAKTDKTKWRIPTEPLKEMCRSGQPIRLRATHIATGIIYEFKSSPPLAEMLGMTRSGLGWNLRNGKRILNGYKIEFVTF